MRVLLVSGIWPPDVGGPASHGPEFGRFLVERGHEVRAVTTIGGPGAVDPGFPLTTARRDRPRLIRHPAAGLSVLASARRAEVIYATGMYGRSVVAASVHRVPLVLKIVSDPAYERARRLGFFEGTLEKFQEFNDHRGVRALKRLRDFTVSRAARIVIPSRYLAEIASGWGLDPERISVIPNPAPPVDRSVSTDELRERLGVESPTFVFAGRIVEQKNLPLAVAALGQVAGATLIIVGDGPAQDELVKAIASSGAGDRIFLKGALPRSEAIAWMRAADAAVLPSDWENFPHAAVEALTAGTPVIATAVGGVPEIIEPGVNGLLVAPGDASAFGAAMTSVVEDPALLASLRDGAGQTADRYLPAKSFGAIEAQLALALGSRR